MGTFNLSISPAFRFAILVITGVLVSHWCDLSLWIVVSLLVLATLFVGIGLVLSRRKAERIPIVIPSVMLIGILSGAAKYAVDSDRSQFVSDEMLNREAVVVGTIVDPPRVANNVVRFVLRANTMKSESVVLQTKENVRVTLIRRRNEPFPIRVSYGMTLALRGTLSRPSGSRNPGEFSEKEYYEANGITAFMLVRGSDNVVILDSTRSFWLMKHVVVPAREYILHVFDLTTKGESAEFLKGLLIGERAGISVSTRQSFVNSGVAHVLAVSGSNVVVVAGVFFFVFGLLRFPKWAVVASTLAALVLYMLVTGSQPPVVRATITASIFLIGSVLQVRANPFNSLGVAALIILAMDARQLFDVGFQLSFVAVLSIIYLYPKMNAWIALIDSEGWIRKAIAWTLRVCAVSLAASLGTLPLTAVYFGKVSVIGLLTNILVIPAVGASVVLGFVTIAANLVSNVIASSYASVNQLLLDCTLWLIRLSGSFSFASADTSRFLPIYALPFYAALLLLFNLDMPRVARRLLIILLVSLNVVVFLPPPAAVAATGTLRVSFLDVGQGDGSVIELPDGRVMVIDAGPSAGGYDAGERTMAPYLKRRGVSRIDMLVVSHPHDDHLGGVPYLMEQFDVADVIESGQPIHSSIYRRYVSDIHEERCSVDTARSGMAPLNFGNLRLYVLFPTPSFIDSDTTHSHPNLNNTSVVLRMQYGNVSFLFTGDAEEEAEEEMVGQYGQFLKSTLLKAGHHGSKTSSTQEFLDAVQPTCAVVSVGRYNKFGHPSQDVLARLRALHADVYRTDEEGAIIFESDGKTLSLVEWR